MTKSGSGSGDDKRISHKPVFHDELVTNKNQRYFVVVKGVAHADASENAVLMADDTIIPMNLIANLPKVRPRKFFNTANEAFNYMRENHPEALATILREDIWLRATDEVSFYICFYREDTDRNWVGEGGLKVGIENRKTFSTRESALEFVVSNRLRHCIIHQESHSDSSPGSLVLHEVH